jgi:hypothetical protein
MTPFDSCTPASMCLVRHGNGQEMGASKRPAGAPGLGGTMQTEHSLPVRLRYPPFPTPDRMPPTTTRARAQTGPDRRRKGVASMLEQTRRESAGTYFAQPGLTLRTSVPNSTVLVAYR